MRKRMSSVLEFKCVSQMLCRGPDQGHRKPESCFNEKYKLILVREDGFAYYYSNRLMKGTQ